MTLVPLLCEDLARLEPVADLVRSIGPSLVVTLLLDGPQLASRWTARYAAVLADDPGSAVCTLTSYGMVRRCRPPGCEVSSVVALWKDATGELTEIALEDGADAVHIATYVTAVSSYTADGRRHPATPTLKLSAFRSLRADGAQDETAPRPPARPTRDDEPGLPPLDEREVSKATSWAEALAEAIVADPAAVENLIVEATALDWRATLGLPPPTRLFEGSIDAVRREVPLPPTLESLVAAAGRLHRSEDPAAKVAGMAIVVALEQRLVTEVRTGRLEPGALRVLTAPT